MAFKIIAWICIGIVAIEILAAIILIIAILLNSDEGGCYDNEDGSLICSETGEHCPYCVVTPDKCNNCEVVEYWKEHKRND